MARITLPPKSLAEGNIKLALLTALNDPSAPTAAELNGGLDISCHVLKDGFRLGPTDSDTIDGMSALCSTSNATAYGVGNAEADITLFRFFADANKATAHASDTAYQALKEKGTTVYLVKRETGKPYSDDFAAKDEVEVYEVLTDNPQPPQDIGGYIRRRIPMAVQNFWINREVAA